MIDTELFELAVEAALRIETDGGIGTLAEHKLHHTLKYYVQPDNTFHEIKRASFVCDAVTDDGVFEIQTRAFNRLTNKLDALLNEGTVTVVYPMIWEKRLLTTELSTGEIKIRKSPLKGSVFELFRELYRIRGYIKHENFRLRVIKLNADEHRLKDSSLKRRRGEKRYLKTERIPTALISDTTYSSPSDYASFLPDGLPEVFGTKELSAFSGLRRNECSIVLRVLTEIGVLERVGKKGNAYLYRRCEAK